jgi:amino acid adenylation domain-containing protein
MTLWNATDSYYEKDLCLHRKLENQALVNPDLVALYCEDKKLTYRELNQNANKLAHYLVSKGIVADDFVPICTGRSLEMMIGIYAILKAGGAYVPVDPGAPTDRLKSILDDAKPKLVLTTKKAATNLPSGKYETIYLDTILTEPFSSDDSNPVVAVNSHNLAYVIYTSGSTGIPKGVMIEHHSVLNRLGWMQEAYPLTPSDVLIQKTPVTFDVSVWELFWWSFAGASLVVLSPGAEKEPEKLTEAIRSFKVSVIHFVPSMFGVFLNFIGTLKEQEKIRSLKNIFLSGEALPPKMVNDFNGIMQGYSSPELINLYGPTEATVDVSYYHCPKGQIIDTMYIGKPISNTKLLILDKYGKIQPVGIPGELVITGVNLSRGYLNRDELNKEKFINIRYFDGSVLRAYRTGDLAKWTDAGEIFYIGRLDNQVKIRGFRIELGDIETKIHEHPSVHNCAVIVAEDTEPKSLIAYICPKPGAVIEAEDMRRFLSSKLPDYMVPPHFVFIDTLPLTSSGKLNRKALPKPERAKSETAIVLPVNNCERQLMNLWRDLLKIDSISINDNFFDIGGNSLLAINLATLISKEFNVVFNTIFLFEYPSIKSQSDYITSKISQEKVTESNEVDEKMRRRKDVNFRKIR